MTCADLAEFVVIRTPVDTGNARAGWQPALNHLPAAMMVSPDPTGLSSISEANLVARSTEGGRYVCTINNVKYILELEYGSSQQAPNGMVRITLAQADDIAKANIAKVRGW